MEGIEAVKSSDYTEAGPTEPFGQGCKTGGVPGSSNGSFVHSVAFSSEGPKIASGSWDKTVKLWDVKSGKLLAVYHLLPGHQAATIDSQDQLLWSSEDAWPYLGWEEKREDRIIRWPIEMFWMLDEKFPQRGL